MKLQLKEIVALQCLVLVCFYIYNAAILTSQTLGVSTFTHHHVRFLDNDIRGVEHSLSNDSGGIHGCARFSTKYEARYIVPWLHYHNRIGISHFHLCVLCLLYMRGRWNIYRYTNIKTSRFSLVAFRS